MQTSIVLVLNLHLQLTADNSQQLLRLLSKHISPLEILV